MSRRFINIKKLIKRINKVDEAIIRYIKLSKTPSIPYRAFINLADYFFIKGSYEQAEELLANAIDFVSQSSDAIVNLGTLKQTQGDVKKAFDFYQKAIEKDPKNIKARCMLGNCYSLQGNIDKAIEQYKTIIILDSRNADAYLCWGINLLKQKKYEQALEKFSLASEYNTKDAKALFMSASVEIELGKYDSALDKLFFIASSTENNYGAYHNIAYIYFKKKDYKKTILYVNKAIEIMPFKIESYLLLGDSYLYINQIEMALNTYQEAENKKLKSFFLYLSWGSALQKAKRYTEAIEKLLYSITLAPKNELENDEVYARLSECYFQIKDMESSKKYIDKSILIDPDNSKANKILANLLIAERNYNDAIKALNIALKNTQDKSDIFRMLAKCYKYTDNIKQSNSYYEKALEYNKDNKHALFEYIYSLNEQKNYEKALTKIRILESLSDDEFEVLVLAFEVNYNIAKEDIYAYNKVKAISIAEKIKQKYPDKYNLEDKYTDLKNM